MKMRYYGGGSATRKKKTGGAKPDFLDFDGDGNRTEPMKNTYGRGGQVIKGAALRKRKHGGRCL